MKTAVIIIIVVAVILLALLLDKRNNEVYLFLEALVGAVSQHFKEEIDKISVDLPMDSFREELEKVKKDMEEAFALLHKYTFEQMLFSFRPLVPEEWYSEEELIKMGVL